MIKTTIEFITKIQKDLLTWGNRIKPWFRGESDDKEQPLCPKIAKYTAEEENYLLQTFRRKAVGLTNAPHREETDMWLFLAQHYGLPTRLLDWTEGALLALFFAINKKVVKPRVYMLNPYLLNELATGIKTDFLNYPLSWGSENLDIIIFH